MKQLSKAGVDIIDLLPVYQNAKKNKELFLPDESHWAQPAIDIAAEIIGNRIKRYIPSQTQAVHSYHLKRTTIPDNIGDLNRYTSDDTLKDVRPYYCTSVMISDTVMYRDTLDSPVLIIGDSFVYYKKAYSAHIGAAIAYAIGYPVTTYAKIGGNQYGANMLKSQKTSFVTNRKVIVWIFASRGLMYPFSSPALPNGI